MAWNPRVRRTGEVVLSPAAFIERLHREGAGRYHDRHPYHVRMHEGRLSPAQLQHWVANRYYYQTRLPVKDALILAKSDDPEFRRRWIERIHDQDGTGSGDDGGLALWLRLAEAVGLAPEDVASCWHVLPGVRDACDAYVDLVRAGSLVEAVATSLTECFAPALLATRIRAWEQHYPWVERKALACFRNRVPQAQRDAERALAFVVAEARTRRLQEACVAALIRKTEILTDLLDALSAAYLDEAPRSAVGATR